jgi:hypothetical protein
MMHWLARFFYGCLRRMWCSVLAAGTIAILSACAGAPLEQPAQPTLTFSPVPTLTQTIIWFPATVTPTQVPMQLAPPTPTANPRPVTGSLILQDNFSSKARWQTLQNTFGSVAFGNQELTLAIAQPKASLFSFRDQLTLNDYYLEIDSIPSLCQDSDQFGVLFRVVSAQDYYRYLMTCGGQLRLERLNNGGVSVIQDWFQAIGLMPGPTGSRRLGIWAVGSDLRLYVDGVFQFSRRDPNFPSGGIGLYARSMKDNIVTINFSNLTIWQTTPGSATPVPVAPTVQIATTKP